MLGSTFVRLSLLVANAAIFAPALILRSNDQHNDCGKPAPLGYSFAQGENKPGAGVTGIDSFKPFQKVLKSGYLKTACVKDYMYYHGDKFGAGKHDYGATATGVSIVHYNDHVAKEDREEMTPDVCFKFCKSVPDMGFFGLLNGYKCYCTPYYKQIAGDSSQCDSSCPGKPTLMCGGKSKSDIYTMHQCVSATTTTTTVTTTSTCPGPTYTLAGVPLTSAKRGLSLTTATFPTDFCADFDLTMPQSKNGNPYGYEGAIAMMGQFYLTVTHTKKLFQGKGTGFGLMAIIQSNGGGPYFTTVGFAKGGERVKASFCYSQTTNKPTFMVDKKEMEAGYLHNAGKAFPSQRDVPLAILTGSHSSDTTEALNGATLHSFQFRPYCIPDLGSSLK